MEHSTNPTFSMSFDSPSHAIECSAVEEEYWAPVKFGSSRTASMSVDSSSNTRSTDEASSENDSGSNDEKLDHHDNKHKHKHTRPIESSGCCQPKSTLSSWNTSRGLMGQSSRLPKTQEKMSSMPNLLQGSQDRFEDDTKNEEFNLPSPPLFASDNDAAMRSRSLNDLSKLVGSIICIPTTNSTSAVDKFELFRAPKQLTIEPIYEHHSKDATAFDFVEDDSDLSVTDSEGSESEGSEFESDSEDEDSVCNVEEQEDTKEVEDTKRNGSLSFTAALVHNEVKEPLKSSSSPTLRTSLSMANASHQYSGFYASRVTMSQSGLDDRKDEKTEPSTDADKKNEEFNFSARPVPNANPLQQTRSNNRNNLAGHKNARHSLLGTRSSSLMKKFELSQQRPRVQPIDLSGPTCSRKEAPKKSSLMQQFELSRRTPANTAAGLSYVKPPQSSLMKQMELSRRRASSSNEKPPPVPSFNAGVKKSSLMEQHELFSRRSSENVCNEEEIQTKSSTFMQNKSSLDAALFGSRGKMEKIRSTTKLSTRNKRSSMPNLKKMSFSDSFSNFQQARVSSGTSGTSKGSNNNNTPSRVASMAGGMARYVPNEEKTNADFGHFGSNPDPSSDPNGDPFFGLTGATISVPVNFVQMDERMRKPSRNRLLEVSRAPRGQRIGFQ